MESLSTTVGRPVERSSCRLGRLVVWFPCSIAWVLGGILIWAGVAKLFTPETGDTVYARVTLHSSLLASAMAFAEIVCGVMLILGVGRRLLFASISALMVVAAGVLTFELSRPEPVACGCFGGGMYDDPFRSFSDVRFELWISIARCVLLACAASAAFLVLSSDSKRASPAA
jgi:uncharacterized membrane protein YphA (DoxX/SURF4 family)